MPLGMTMCRVWCILSDSTSVTDSLSPPPMCQTRYVGLSDFANYRMRINKHFLNKFLWKSYEKIPSRGRSLFPKAKFSSNTAKVSFQKKRREGQPKSWVVHKFNWMFKILSVEFHQSKPVLPRTSPLFYQILNTSLTPWLLWLWLNTTITARIFLFYKTLKQQLLIENNL